MTIKCYSRELDEIGARQQLGAAEAFANRIYKMLELVQ